jgi:alkylated DNA nucleotide flippase Atl1
MEQDEIETIPKTMEKFFGCSGKMVKPSTDTVKKIIKRIRKGKLVTINQLREKIASDFGVQTACPASTTKALQLLSKENRPVCYWRVIKKKGELIAKFPKGLEGHASLLQKEGFEIDFSGKNPVVVGYEIKLVINLAS